MSTNDDGKSYELLRELANTVKKNIDDGLSNGTLKHEEEIYFRWKIEGFKYDDNGPTYTKGSHEYPVKRTWSRTTERVKQEIKKSSAYKTCLDLLKEMFGDKASDDNLNRFVTKVASYYLQEQKFDERKIDELIEKLIKGLKGEPLIYGAEVLLVGVVLRPDKIEPVHGVSLRKTVKEDLEKEFPYNNWFLAMFQHHVPFHLPTAILKIEFLGTRAREIPDKVTEAIVLLRLFNVGDVKYISYHINTESLTDFMADGTSGQSDVTVARDRYLIDEGDVESLKRFWTNLQPLLPKSLLQPESGQEDHITIAYKRYTDALLQNGSIEGRIANAIMGLEALLLKPGEMEELSYRLKNRVAKILNNFKYEPFEVKKTVGDAYNVRSRFVHGGKLSCDGRKNLEKHYKSVNKFSNIVLDYLRVCIIAYITLNMEKDKFIDLTDASFLDRKSEEQLTGALNKARTCAVR